MRPNNNEKRTSHYDACSPIVSVIVVIYNQNLERIIKTLDSILFQEDISFEIIICDDGSEKCHKEDLKNYFNRNTYFEYSLIFHDHNEGTVSNYYSGLKIAKGKYAKLISPGDYLAEKKTLYKWIQFLNENNAEWSFSDAYYYQCDHGRNIFIQTKAMPQIIHPYVRNNLSRCIWNYTALLDVAIGAAIIGTTDIQMRYCRTIQEKGIRYCEDFIYRLMMFHGIVGYYFPEVAVCYEYGIGVSSSGDMTWGKKLTEDRKKLAQMMLNKENTSIQQKKMAYAFLRNIQDKKVRKLFIRGKFFLWMKCHFYPRMTPIPEEVCEHDGNT